MRHTFSSLLLATAAIVTGACSAIAQESHWSFQRPSRPSIPKTSPKTSVINPIDAFVISRLQTRHLSPSPSADRRTLIRRLTFDLTGLPPTPAESKAFLTDKSPNAYATLVERLLRSSHFGERWGQHWLDVVRFAESNGYEHDLDRPQAWRYRDWVVASFNADKPYDRFVREQVAGDLLFEDNFEARVATGFLRAGPFHITGGNLDPKEMRQEWLTEAVNGIGSAILGITVGCARCHDHKIDPIPQKDYYRLQAFFAATANDDSARASDTEKLRYEQAFKANKDLIKPLEARIAVIEKPYRERLRARKLEMLPPEYKAVLAIEASRRTEEQRKLASAASTQLNISWDEVVESLSQKDRAARSDLRQQIFAIQRTAPEALPSSVGSGEMLKPRPVTHVFTRGDVHKSGEVVNPGLPECIAPKVFPIGLSRTPAAPAEPNRVTLARWLTSPENPLTARVMVNRIWHYLFGRGIVATPNDYGKNGKVPTHPELLDWLALDFERDWSIKRMIKMMVQSNTYRQSSVDDRTKAARDPENTLLWRMNRKRLDAEAIRDSVLLVSGSLNRAVGGPSVRLPLEPEVYDTIFTEYEPDNLWEPTPDARQHSRRTIYLFRKRNVRLPMLALFDQPDMMTSCAARGQTIHALQALTLINGVFMRTQSDALARRIHADVPRNRRGRIERVFAVILGRPPAARELLSTERFLEDQTRLTDPVRATADLCLATLNLNEFLYIR